MLQVRVFYMHRFGGMYADLDMEALRDLTPLLKDSTEPVLAYLSDTWTLRHNIPNAWMASPPGHPFWLVRTGVNCRLWGRGMGCNELML